MDQTIILGGGISGLLAAHVLRGPRTILLERSDKLGGSYTSGGLKYIRATLAMRYLLDRLGLKWETYVPQGALVLRDDFIVAHPDWISGMTPEARLEIQKLHWRRTRGSLDGFTPTCMNDPMGDGGDVAIRVDHRKLLAALMSSAQEAGTILLPESEVVEVQPHFVEVKGMGTMPYSRLVTTLPLPIASRLFKTVKIPPSKVAQHTLARIPSIPTSMANVATAAIDYIYTPFWQSVYRLSRDGEGWQAEMVGNVEDASAEPAFKKYLMEVTSLSKFQGHLLPLPEPISWPRNVLPLGRFAEWDTRSTAEKSLARVMAWRNG